ncbi:MAG: bifunctional oligoribonuclease/PAP phosphatase NrnA [Candidatus Tectomicrobia bacterium]|nr:bifunctional oligoribonuclease/PAP phosphatase NrnA [Candidatus Tectomicrobia bacterium]
MEQQQSVASLVASNAVPRSMAEKLASFLQLHRGEHHIIAIQNFPDPDAISSGFAHLLISRGFGIECEIVYDGIISHQQNIALTKLLEIDLTRYQSGFDFKRFDGAVFIDNQGTTTSLTERLHEAGVKDLIVVDHHEKQYAVSPEFCDIQKVGATATIYTGYLQAGLVSFERTNKTHVRCATALMHGIITETSNLLRAGEEDFYAAAYLSSFTDQGLLSDIMNQARSKKVMSVIQKALENRVVQNNVSVAGIGYLRAEDRDAIPQAADFLLTEENVHTAIVYGIVIDADKTEMLVGSLRTSKITLDPDHFLKESFGRDAAGRYFGGGRHDAGGFTVPLGFLSGTLEGDFTYKKWEIFDAQVKQKVFEKLGADDKEMVKPA